MAATAAAAEKRNLLAAAADEDDEPERPAIMAAEQLHAQVAQPPAGWRGKIRWLVAVLGFSMEVVCYADRTNLSLALVPMSTEFGYSEQTTGLILSSFFVGCNNTHNFQESPCFFHVSISAG